MTPTPRRAYSYVRFSTVEQLKGKSLERQTEAAAAYCLKQGLILDTELTLQDLGVSAFRGKNAATGALSVFLDNVKSGMVPKGSFLLIETFDRMSRESAYDAQLTLQLIIQSGVTVVTLLDQKEYSVAILRAEPMALIIAILYMSRSHEESATKSKRVGDAWRRKRERLARGETLTARVPGWIKVDKLSTGGKDRKPQLIPARANVVRKVFEMFLAGSGRPAIAAELNAKKVPTFGGAQYWHAAYIRAILASRAVLGEFQGHREETTRSGERKRIPEGVVVKQYFPMVIDRRTFDRVQALSSNRAASPNAALRGKPPRNLLAGLSTCPKCGGRMMRMDKGRGRPKYVCNRFEAGAGCKSHRVVVKDVEDALLENAEALYSATPGVDSNIPIQLAATEAALKSVEDRLLDLALLLDDTPSRTVGEKLQAGEAQREELVTKLTELRARAAQHESKYVRERVRKMRDALLWHADNRDDPGSVIDVNRALRECFERVVIDYSVHKLEMHWRHVDAPTRIPYRVDVYAGR